MKPLTFGARARSDVVFAYAGAALAALLVLLGWMAARPDLALRPAESGLAAFGLLHLDVLGWITMTMFGTSFNLVPVILHPARLPAGAGRRLLIPYAVGVGLFVLGFARAEAPFLAAGGTLVASVLLAHAALWIRAVGPILKSDAGRLPTAWAFALAPVFLAETAILGLVMALALAGLLPGRFVAMAPIHMAAAIGGWLGMVVVGAAYRLIPLFFATERGHEDDRFGRPAVAALAVAVVATQLAHVGASWATGLAWAAALAGVAAFGMDIVRMVRHRAHRKREPVTVLTVAALAHGLAAVLTVIAGEMGAAPPGWPVLALYLGLFAAPTLLIVGQLSRILVFLTTLDLAEWARDHNEPRRTWNVSRPRLSYAGYILLQAGILGLATAMVAGRPLQDALARPAALLQLAGGIGSVAALWPTFATRRHMREREA
ncbi:MAG: hypothetical protein IMW98_01115 [Firmicutes bacterium]|nr:hypothetical protein [Bacillota bacterium]